MSSVSSVVIKIGAQTAEAVAGIRNVDRALGDAQTTGEKFQGAVQRAAIPAAAALTALTAVAIKSAKAAAEDAQSKERLDAQLRRTTGATAAQISVTEAWIDSTSRAVAVADDELRPALGNLVRATGDAAKAQELLRLALDTSAATGKPLESVTAAIGKAYAGNTGALAKLVPSLGEAAKKGASFAELQRQLNEQVKGAAAGDAQTAAGQYRAMGIAVNELQESIGAALLPALQTLLPLLTQVAQVAGAHPAVFVAIAGAVAAVSVAVLAANAAISINTALTELNVAANLKSAAASVLSAAKWVIQTAAMIAYRVAATAVSVATRIMTVAQIALNVALAANPVGLVVIALAALAAGLVLAYRHSAAFRGIVQSAFQVARENILLVLGPLGLMAKALITLYQHSGTVREIVTAAMRAITDAVNDVIDAIESLVSWIGKIHFPSKPSWLPGNPFSLSMPAMATAGVSPYAAGAPTVHVTIQGAIDPEATALAVRRVLNRYDRRRGQRPLGGEFGGAGNG